ncbi:DUF4124 domain-containing protein [Methylogaea oryzae]|uniref:DUF4124 domain-containing protein n=1 Tax=Methylogaea oryzae TaxID=1295382 RepID=UPI0006D046D5|nr:DUF4124 domain-containing protein [Methylogaea oryzae]
MQPGFRRLWRGAKNRREKLFRWTDKEGKVHYGDRLPPEQSQIGGTKYDPSGLNKQVIEGAKTPEQLEAEAKLKRFRAEQERLLAEQSDHDQALLRSFRSEEEVRMALQGNLNTLNTQLKLIQANLQRQQEKLAPLQQQADGLQKSGKPLPKEMAKNLEAVQRQVASYQEQIGKNEAEKVVLTERSERDVARLRVLKTLSSNGRSVTEAAKGSAIDLVAGAVRCSDKESCDKGWNAAREYAKKLTAEPLTIDTDRLLRTAEPTSDNDLAVIVARIPGQNGDTLFLDLRCGRTSVGQALCAGDRSREIRQGFRKALAETAGLTAQ